MVSKEILETLEYIEHNKADLILDLVACKKNVLQYKLDLYDVVRVGNNKNISPVSVKKKNIIVKIRPDSNKDKILNFIKKSPQIRAREILEEFNLVSGRTVKRNIKELLDAGLITKMSEDHAVYYSFIKT